MDRLSPDPADDARRRPRRARPPRLIRVFPATEGLLRDARSRHSVAQTLGSRSGASGPASNVTAMLRYLTAGESHGQALVVIVEGLPAGLAVTVEDIQAELARRRLGYGRGPAPALRGRRADAARRRPPRPHARLAGGHRDQEHRVVPQRQVARRDVAGAGRDRGAADPGAPGPRRPRRDAEVRVHRRPRRARAGQRPGDRGPRRRRRRWPSCCSPSSASTCCRTSCRWARRGRPAPRPTLEDLAVGRRVAGALLRPRRGRGDDRRDQGGGQGRRLARRRRRGARLRRAGRPRQPRPLGPQARRPARPGGDEHPGGEGRRDRRRVRGRRPAGERGPRRDPLGRRRRRATAATRRSPAASRAACRPASCSSCGRR